jgi:type II secretory pathway component PulJ
MSTRGTEGGFSLIECLVYIAVLTVVTGLSFSAFYQTQRSSADLRRNADDILRTLRAGERWRADVRAAIAPPTIVDGRLQISQRSMQVTYVFEQGTVWRMERTARTAALKKVENSRMQLDAGEHVSAWRWEVELATPHKNTRVRPLFTFQAVSGASP